MTSDSIETSIRIQVRAVIDTNHQSPSTKDEVRSTKCRPAGTRCKGRDATRQQWPLLTGPPSPAVRFPLFALHPLCFFAALVLTAFLAQTPRSSLGLALDDREAVDAARDGLSRKGQFPWYDAETDEVRPTHVAPLDPPPKIRDWEWTPSKNGGSGLGRIADIIDVLTWFGLGLLMVVLAALIVRAFLQRARLTSNATRFASTRGNVAGDVGRVEKLPFPVKRPQSDLLGEARRHYEAGNFVEAIIYLFSYQLVHLDKHDLVRLAKGKTNRQYLREMKPHRDIVRVVSETMRAFEDVFFGGHDLDREGFEACWNQLGQFHQDVQQVAAADHRKLPLKSVPQGLNG